jgi:hypothetical protein
VQPLWHEPETALAAVAVPAADEDGQEDTVIWAEPELQPAWLSEETVAAAFCAEAAVGDAAVFLA